jgi:radical SAM superfamily enzyme YgiQ (UPF0313 family)
VRETDFGDLIDVIFVGEADEAWPQFLEDWAAGRHQRRYEQQERTDLTKLPAPRLDLLPMQHYRFGSIQMTRGCPSPASSATSSSSSAGSRASRPPRRF